MTHKPATSAAPAAPSDRSGPPARGPADGQQTTTLAAKTIWQPLQGLPRHLLMGVVRIYRLLFKAWLGNACRFEPSCSAYTLQALESHGALRGSALGAWRILRCHPWCAGGLDPVPSHFSLGRAQKPRFDDTPAQPRNRPGPGLNPAHGMFTGLVDPTEPVVRVRAPTMPDQNPPVARHEPRQPQTPPASPRTLS